MEFRSYHIVSGRKVFSPQGNASLPPQKNIVTPVEQLLLFTKSFSFFWPHFWGQCCVKQFTPRTNQAKVHRRGLAAALEVLDCPLMFLRLLERIEGPEISSSSGLGILLSGVKPVLP
jgi:hypothetical protein